MATAKLLYQNRIPYINKNGFKRIGLKYQKKMHGRDFDRIEKPSANEWERGKQNKGAL